MNDSPEKKEAPSISFLPRLERVNKDHPSPITSIDRTANEIYANFIARNQRMRVTASERFSYDNDEFEDRFLVWLERANTAARDGLAFPNFVFFGKDQYDGSDVAIKIIHPSIHKNKDSQSEFINEIISLQTLNEDPGIVNMVDYTVFQHLNKNGQTEVFAAIIMDKLHPIDKEEDFTLEQAVKLGYQVALTLDRAHAQGLVHRDIKRGNLARDDNNNVIVLDTGLMASISDLEAEAKKRDEMSSTQLSNALQKQMRIVGTARFLAPEDIRPNVNEFHGPAADQHMLALTLYELINGMEGEFSDFFDDPNFEAQKADAQRKISELKKVDPQIKVDMGLRITANAHRPYLWGVYPAHDDNRLVLKKSPLISDEVYEVFSKAVAYDPKMRYQSCTLFVEDLARKAGYEIKF